MRAPVGLGLSGCGFRDWGTGSLNLEKLKILYTRAAVGLSPDCIYNSEWIASTLPFK